MQVPLPWWLMKGEGSRRSSELLNSNCLFNAKLESLKLIS